MRLGKVHDERRRNCTLDDQQRRAACWRCDTDHTDDANGHEDLPERETARCPPRTNGLPAPDAQDLCMSAERSRPCSIASAAFGGLPSHMRSTPMSTSI